MAQSIDYKETDNSDGRDVQKSPSNGCVHAFPYSTEETQPVNHFKRSGKKKKKRKKHSTDVCKPPVRKYESFQESPFISLPLEILLKILSEYTLSARDLISLALSCKHFSAALLSGLSLVEEAARLNTYLILSRSIPCSLQRIQADAGTKQQQTEPIPRYREESWLKLYHHVHSLFVGIIESGTVCYAGGSHTAVVMGGELYTFGLGKNGQLGLGSRSDALFPTQVNIQPYGRDYNRRGLRVERVRVTTVSCGLLHTAVVSAGGVLYTCGMNQRGELGYSVSREEDEADDQGYCPNFYEVHLPEQIWVQAVECGDHHTALITQTGLVYTFGGNEHGQLGLGDYLDRRRPELVEKLSRFICVQVSAFTHTAALTACGQLFTFGEGNHGQLGTGDTSTRPVPVRVSALRNRRVVHVAAGYAHMLLVTSEGELYSCGWNAHYRLGLRELPPTKRVAEPTRVQLPGGERVRKVWAGMSHSLALSERGKLYGWGRNVYGELGLVGMETEYQATPKCILSLDHAVTQASGGVSHTLAVTETGEVYSWGSGLKGRLGHGTTHNKIYPDPIKI